LLGKANDELVGPCEGVVVPGADTDDPLGPVQGHAQDLFFDALHGGRGDAGRAEVVVEFAARLVADEQGGGVVDVA
jgi:hypothetical protein